MGVRVIPLTLCPLPEGEGKSARISIPVWVGMRGKTFLSIEVLSDFDLSSDFYDAIGRQVEVLHGAAGVARQGGEQALAP